MRILGETVEILNVDGEVIGSGVVEGHRAKCKITKAGHIPYEYRIAGVCLPLRDRNGEYLTPSLDIDIIDIDLRDQGPLNKPLWVMIDYENWKGVRKIRTVEPIEFKFMISPWHKDKQWIMEAWDVETGERREFAMSGIKSWSPCS